VCVDVGVTSLLLVVCIVASLIRFCRCFCWCQLVSGIDCKGSQSYGLIVLSHLVVSLASSVPHVVSVWVSYWLLDVLRFFALLVAGILFLHLFLSCFFYSVHVCYCIMYYVLRARRPRSLPRLSCSLVLLLALLMSASLSLSLYVRLTLCLLLPVPLLLT